VGHDDREVEATKATTTTKGSHEGHDDHEEDATKATTITKQDATKATTYCSWKGEHLKHLAVLVF
jgi:hypothetical protein